MIEAHILDPDLPIIDAHHHLADRIGEPFASIIGYRRFLIDEYLEQVGRGHRIVGSVFMQANAMYRADGPEDLRPVGETEFVNGQAAMAASGTYGPCRMAAGIVGHADLMLGDRVKPVLEAHMQAAPARFRGVRFEGAWDEDPAVLKGMFHAGEGLYGNSAFRAGFAQLEPLGLTFDAFVLSPQLPDVIDLSRDFPGSAIILNHCGNPVDTGRHKGKLAEAFAAWRSSMAGLAECPNVAVKFGGLGTFLLGFPRDSAMGSDALAAFWRPYVETTIELFGADRCMFESNLPIDRAGTFETVCNAHKKILQSCSLDERKDAFAGTANRIYRLGLEEALA
jgi:predicted TIM-barrel fold metal-dependent hydrolase